MRVAVIGGGQLGRMLALAGVPLGIETVHLDPAADACAGQLARLTVGSLGDRRLVAALCEGAVAVTVDVEHVPVDALGAVPAGVPVRPPAEALAVAQDRLREKQLFAELGIPLPAFAPVDGPGDFAAAGRTVGFPLLLKLRLGGFDGRGQALVQDAAGLEAAWHLLGERPLVAEAIVDFQQEVSQLVVRGADGAAECYQLVANEHVDGMLRASRVPAGVPARLEEAARHAALAVAERLGHVGVLALELFVAGGELLANEIAPRVHNSGHWTIEGAETSQFENHLRAVCGLPLGSTASRGPCGLVNLVGAVPPRADVLAVPGASLHVYGKGQREGRKVGHVTVTAAGAGPGDAAAAAELERRIAAVRALADSAAATVGRAASHRITTLNTGNAVPPSPLAARGQRALRRDLPLGGADA